MNPNIITIFVLIPFFVLMFTKKNNKLFLVFYFCFFALVISKAYLNGNYSVFAMISLLLLFILIVIPTTYNEILVSLLSLFFFSFSLINCRDLITLFLLLECISICVFIIINQSFRHVIGLESALKYLLINLISSSLLLLSIFFLYLQWGVFNISNILFPQASNPQFFFLDFCGTFLMALSFLIKLSVFPFHNWMLDVYKGLRNESLLIVSAFSKVVLFVAIYNVSFIFQRWFFLFFFCSIISLFYGSLLLLFETHSTMFIGQLSLISSGYSLLFIYMQNKWLLIFYLFSQSINLIFFIFFLSNIEDLRYTYNLFDFNYFVSLIYFLIVVSLIGIPPFLTFLPKFFLFNWLLPHYFLILYLIFISLLNGVALLRVCIYSFISSVKSHITSQNQIFLYYLLSFLFIFVQSLFTFSIYTVYLYA